VPLALVTGASTGIGRATALRLAGSGWTVLAGVRNEAAAQALRDTAGGASVKPITLDITLLDQVDAAAAAVEQEGGRLDALVNNAGIGVGGPLELLGEQELRYQFDVNVFGQVAMTRALLPALRRAHGRIVFISSIGGKVPMAFTAPYAATKHAIEALASTMKAELNLFGIGVATINPGLYRTGYNETGAESHDQWSALQEVLIPMPPAKPLLALQHDPQPLIDAMVETIPDRKGPYRLMMPEDAVVETKAAQALGWTQKAR